MIFNSALPKNLPFVNGMLKKKGLQQLVQKCYLTSGLQTTVGLGYGKLSVGNGRALNAHDNASLFRNVKVNRGLLSGAERDMFDSKKGPADANTLSKFLHRAVDGNWVQKGSIANGKR